MTNVIFACSSSLVMSHPLIRALPELGEKSPVSMLIVVVLPDDDDDDDDDDDKSSEHAHRCRLAGPVVPEQSCYLPLVRVEGDVVHGHHCVHSLEHFPQSVHLE